MEINDTCEENECASLIFARNENYGNEELLTLILVMIA